MGRAKLAVLFILLLALMASPLRLMNGRSFDGVKVLEGGLLGENEKEEQMDIAERVEIILSNSDSVQGSGYVSVGENEDIISRLEEEIVKMQGYDILPMFKIESGASESYTRRVYVGDDNKGVNLWLVKAAYDNIDIYAFMDAEIGAVYDITTFDKDGSLRYEKDFYGSGFIDYLNSFSEYPHDWKLDIEYVYKNDESYVGILTRQGETLGVGCIYKKDEAYVGMLPRHGAKGEVMVSKSE